MLTAFRHGASDRLAWISRQFRGWLDLMYAIHLLRDGRLAEHWDVVDTTNFLASVGVLPVPPTAAKSQR